MRNTPDRDDFHTKTKHINTLFQFIKDNKEEEFLEYLSNLNKGEVDINTPDENGNYIITIAVVKNFQLILKKVIEYGSRLDIIDTDGYSLLYYPIKFNYREIINILLENDTKMLGISLINIRDMRGAVPIFYAIKYRNNYALQQLLIHEADANYRNRENMNALHLAVLRRDLTIVQMLIKYIKNIDARTKSGSSALHYACNFQVYEITKLLLEAGANQNIPEYEYDFYPIFYTVVQNNIPITKLLVDFHANPNNQDYLGNTIIHYSIINNHDEILDYLINSYSVRTHSDIYTENINNQHTIVDQIVNYIDPEIVNIEGLTIIHLLLYNYRETYKPYLLKLLSYTNINYQDNLGNTPLHILAEKNLFMEYASSINQTKLNIFIKNNKNQTVFDLVRVSQRDDFIKVIVNSFKNYLVKHPNQWEIDWQNQCSQIQDQSAFVQEDCDKRIKQFILDKKISVPLRKNKTVITISQNEKVQFSTFTGSVLDLIVGFKYLVKKYPDSATILHNNTKYNDDIQRYFQKVGIQDNPHQHLIHFEIRWVYQQLFLPPKFETILADIIRSNRHKYIIIPIGIILSNGNHSNGLFINLEEQLIERFEPHGSSYPSQFNYNPDLLDDILNRKLTMIMRSIYQSNQQTHFRYHRPRDYLPKIGFQTFESVEINVNKNIGDPNGFCTLWTIWYFDYRLKYSQRKSHNVVKNLINQIRINNFSFRTIMRNYSKKITDLRDGYLDKIGKDINDYLNNRLSLTELTKLTDIIYND